MSVDAEGGSKSFVTLIKWRLPFKAINIILHHQKSQKWVRELQISITEPWIKALDCEIVPSLQDRNVHERRVFWDVLFRLCWHWSSLKGRKYLIISKGSGKFIHYQRDISQTLHLFNRFIRYFHVVLHHILIGDVIITSVP